ncbi:MAG: hypothetical protein ABFD50_17295 [Smithella sp.]
MLKKIFHYIPRFFSSKDMIVYLTAVILLSVLAFFGFGKLAFAYQNAQDTKEKIADMTAFVDDWNQQVIKLNQEPYRPVREDQVDDVQSNILLLMAANQLSMNSFKSIQDASQKKPSGSLYEMEVEGPWESTVRILGNFHVRDALLAIQNVKLSPVKNGGVKTILEYKIYTKPSAQPSQGK